MKQLLEKPDETTKDTKQHKTKQERQQHQFREGTSEMRILSLGHINDKPVTKVLLRPLTGRKHQLRLHSLLLDHPIVGDDMYGACEKTERKILHAFFLSVPIQKEYLKNCKEKRSIIAQTQDPF